jgi:serine/threonine-protein kinase
MALAAGIRFGPYQVAESIGSGGMGEVYRATDTNLKRDVAIKLLPQAFADDVDRVARFQREAEALAALNHPNIAQIHGLERSDGSTVLVLELVEGATLADRIAQGPIPYDEALGIAMQVAGALEAAHGRGIVHRDLKPANIKVRPDGTVKVLDFGIATAPESPIATSGRRSPALLTPALTEAGILLGTAAYMSPEQARGKPVDERADIWAFGCLLYEMLTGQPAFGGEDVTTTLARVLEREANVSALPTTASAAVRHTINLCLEKNPRRRIADIRDVRLALEGQFETADTVRVDGGREVSAGWRRLATIAGAALAGGAVVGLAGLSVWPEPEPKPVRRFAYTLPEGQSFVGTANRTMDLSPDGRSLIYNGVGGFRVWDMGTLEDRAIQNTDDALFEPTFSPDGQSIAYLSESGIIHRMPATGGPALPVTDTSRGGQVALSWARDGTIFFRGNSGDLMRVPATGGTPELIAAAGGAVLFGGGSLLPDDDTVLYGRNEALNSFQVIAQSISTGERTVVANLPSGTYLRYVPTGHLVYADGGTLFGIAFDARTKRTTGSAVPLVQGVLWSNTTGNHQFAIANDGTLAYVRGISGGLAARTLTWVDRAGRETPLGIQARNYLYVEISPDGTRLALDIRDQENDAWVYDLERETLQRLTFDPGRNRGAIWAPDGRRIAFSRQLGDSEEIYWQAADGSGAAEALTQGSGMPVHPSEFTSDGTTLLYTKSDLPRDIFTIPVAGPAGVGTPLLDGPASEGSPTVSPDGRWLAYSSDESGDYEVYVRPFPDVDAGRWQVSTAGGIHPQWSPAGRELFYLAVRPVGVAMMAVAVDSGETFRPSVPAELFQGEYYYGATVAAPDVYDIAPDGQRFLMIMQRSAPGEAVRPDIVVVQNWFEELERLVPTQ